MNKDNSLRIAILYFQNLKKLNIHYCLLSDGTGPTVFIYITFLYSGYVHLECVGLDTCYASILCRKQVIKKQVFNSGHLEIPQNCPLMIVT